VGAYLVLTPNQKKSVAQAWRVGYGDPYNRYNCSFVTDEWLLQNVIPNVENQRDLLPKQFILNTELFQQIKHKFQKNKLQIEADFDHIVTKYWDRIIGEYNKRSNLNVPSKEETTRLLKKAFDGVRRDKRKHELLTPMLYVDSHNTQHSVEYMVPLPIDVPLRHSRNNNHHHHHHNGHGYERIWFAAALVSRERNHAQLMSILSADMAYSNARLIGSVNTQWLQKLAPLYHKLESQLSHKITPVLKVYHIEQEDDENVERFLHSAFSKYGKIVSVEVSLVSSPNENDLDPSDQFSACVQFANSHSVIEAYNGTMDQLNRGETLGFELDFELIKEMEERERKNEMFHASNSNHHAVHSSVSAASSPSCHFSLIFSQPHILPPPDQLFQRQTADIGPFYPRNRIRHECSHCHVVTNNNSQSHHTHHHHHQSQANSASSKSPNYRHSNHTGNGGSNRRNNHSHRQYYNNNSKNNHAEAVQDNVHVSTPQPHRDNNNGNNRSYHHHHNSHSHSNYRLVYKHETDWQVLTESLRSFGINASYIKFMKRCLSPNGKKSRADFESNKKSTTDTTLWYQTSASLASQIANNGFIFKFMTDFSKLMDTSGFKFETNPRVSNKAIMESNHNEIHLFQCSLRLTDKQLGYLRHNGNIIITDTRIIRPSFWIVLSKK